MEWPTVVIKIHTYPFEIDSFYLIPNIQNRMEMLVLKNS